MVLQRYSPASSLRVECILNVSRMAVGLNVGEIGSNSHVNGLRFSHWYSVITPIPPDGTTAANQTEISLQSPLSRASLVWEYFNSAVARRSTGTTWISFER